MSALTGRIDDVLRQHKATTRRIKHPWRKGILLNIAACTGCDWGDEETTEDDHAAHVAELIGAEVQTVTKFRVWDGPIQQENT